jgi:predicted DNA-binding protein
MQPIKAFQVRLPKDIWVFLKKISAEQERSMNTIIQECVNKYIKKVDSK